MISAWALLAALAAPGPAAPGPTPFADSVAALAREVESRPAEFPARAEAAWRALCGPSMAPATDPEIGRLRAFYFHRLAREHAAMRRTSPSAPDFDSQLRGTFAALRKRYGKTETEMREDPDTARVLGPGRYRFLAASALMRNDTVAAQAAARAGWERFRLEDDYLELLALASARGPVPDTLLREGLRALPGAPATRVAAFDAWMVRGDSASIRQALDLAARAQAEWDGSPAWKIRHARALLRRGKAGEAEGQLLKALDLLDEGPGEAGEAERMRAEVFALMDSARGKRPGARP